ncbi:MAG: hypothetical protein AB1472_07390, partial [Candidatus Omnitrophota bacterium]
MFKKPLIAFLIITLFFVFVKNSLAYDDKTTHPALTQEIIDFYNVYFFQKITPEQKEWIIEGSILEDTVPRWINHFYDPVYQVGWTGEKAGNVSASLVNLFSKAILMVGQDPLSTVEWVNNPLVQKDYALYEGDRTWKKALKYYTDGNEKEAYKTLGFVLHLLEDMAVPDHTRNDTHAPLEQATGDDGSPFEAYLTKYNRQTIKDLNLPQNLSKQGQSPITKQSVEEYLISLAQYSNKYFFSKDTINDLKYQEPKIVRDDGEFGYGRDENGEEFALAKIFKGNYFLEKSDISILNSYFSRLSRQAVLHGAGLIDLFFKQAREAEENKNYPIHIIKVEIPSVPNISG